MKEPRAVFLELRREGDLTAAEDYLHSLPASAWTLAAMAQLRSLRSGGESEVHKLLQQAESALVYEDYHGHMELFKAYELVLGEGGFEENMLQAHKHLVAAAACDPGTDAILSLARRSANGTAVIDPNPAEAIRWYEEANSRGSAEAAMELKRLKSRIH